MDTHNQEQFIASPQRPGWYALILPEICLKPSGRGDIAVSYRLVFQIDFFKGNIWILNTYIIFQQDNMRQRKPLFIVRNCICRHYNDVIMRALASQITSVSIVYWTVGSDTDERKIQRSASLAFLREIHRWPVNSPHKRPVTRRMWPFDDVIMEPPSPFVWTGANCIARYHCEKANPSMTKQLTGCRPPDISGTVFVYWL